MRVVLVAGPPCAGKSTYVQQHRGEDDVVIDFDALAHALGYPASHVAWPADAHPARTVALRARASALRAAGEVLGRHTVWIVSANPTPPTGISVSETHVIDPGLDECCRRADERPDVDHASLHREIEHWYAAHAADLDAPSRSW